jgi:hypothetical protein
MFPPHAETPARGSAARGQAERAGDEPQTELDVHPGYRTVAIEFTAGGAPGQVVWVDDMAFGYVG